MKSAFRFLLLGGLAAGTLAVIWVVGRRSTPQQAATLRPLLDRVTEAKATVDRVGQELAKVSDAEEVKLGERLLQREPELGQACPPGLEQRQVFVEEILARLVKDGGPRRPGLPYRVRVIDHPSVNAFAVPGGHLFVTSALLDFSESEAEVASVIGHELAHVDLRHCIERFQYALRAKRLGGPPLEAMASLGARLMLQGYQDEQEAEADRWGMQLAARAGYHPQAAQRFMARMEHRQAPPPGHLSGEAVQVLQDALEDYFSSHPRGELRVANLERSMAEAKLDPGRIRYYVGVQNRNAFTSRSRREFPSEFVRKRLDP